MEIEGVLTAGGAAYAASILAAHLFAWNRNVRFVIVCLAISVAIPAVLLVIGLGNHDAHGTGLNGLDLLMVLATPLAALAALVFAATSMLIVRIRRRAEFDETMNPEFGK